MLSERPTVLPAESQWINTIAPEIGVPDESFTVPLNCVSLNAITGVVTASMKSRSLRIWTPATRILAKWTKGRVIGKVLRRRLQRPPLASLRITPMTRCHCAKLWR